MKKNKNKYTSPEINIIKLDNDISLQLASKPPIGPGEGGTQSKMNSRNIDSVDSDPYQYENW